MCIGMPGSPSFHMSFGNGLGYYPLTFLQGHGIGIKSGLLAIPANLSGQLECGIMLLAQA